MRTNYLIILFASLFVFGCVSKKKYEDLSVKKSSLEVEKEELGEGLKLATAENQRLSSSIEDFTQRMGDLESDTTELGNLYRDLIKDYTSLSKTSASDAQQLSNQLSKVGMMSKELAKKDAQLAKDTEEIGKLRSDLEAREARVQELESLVSQLEGASRSLKDKISNALLGFTASDLTVEVKDGKIYVSLAEDLLFKSGSYSIDEKGKGALAKIAEVLKDQKDITIVVEGHTDDVPMRPGEVIKDNWDLSVMRATAIVKTLTKSGLQPEMVAASGRGEFVPKVNDTTKEARAKNRRSEIIISPNLADLFNLLEQQK